jgi:predicted TIM-barrel fold metal-dependent hydrolase
VDLKSLRHQLDAVQIIDTHEHFLPPDYLTRAKNVLGQVIRNTYLGIDCIVSGSPRELWESGSMVHSDAFHEVVEDIPPLVWEEIVPSFWKVQFTSYFRSMMLGLEKLYQVNPGTDIRKWIELEKRVQAAYQDPCHFEAGLEAAGIAFALRDPYFAVADPGDWSERISSVFRVDDFIGSPWHNDPHQGDTAADIARKWGREIDSLDSYIAVLEDGFTRYAERNFRAVKTACAYRRGLTFSPAAREDAESAFSALRSGFEPQAHLVLGNFMLRQVLRLCVEHNKPLQVHTGMNYGSLDEANPIRLVNLFQEYPQAKFALFHGGYPYADEIALLAKSFPNVYLDLVWMPQLSQTMCVEMLARWIDLVPVNKIMWGGDVWTVEECAGSAHYFKDTLAQALMRKHTEQSFTEAECLLLANRILWENAFAFYELEGQWQAYDR